MYQLPWNRYPSMARLGIALVGLLALSAAPDQVQAQASTQSPTAASADNAGKPRDLDARLRALEEKMDRLLKLLGAPDRSAKPTKEQTEALRLEMTIQLTEARDKLLKELAMKQNAYSQFRRMAMPAGNIQQNRLPAIESKRTALMLQRAEVEGYLSVIKQVQQAGVDRTELMSMAKRIRASLGIPMTADKPEQPVDPIALLIRELQNELQLLEALEAPLVRLYKIAQQETQAHSALEDEDERFRKDIDRTYTLLHGITTRLQELTLKEGAAPK